MWWCKYLRPDSPFWETYIEFLASVFRDLSGGQEVCCLLSVYLPCPYLCALQINKFLKNQSLKNNTILVVSLKKE